LREIIFNPDDFFTLGPISTNT